MVTTLPPYLRLSLLTTAIILAGCSSTGTAPPNTFSEIVSNAPDQAITKPVPENKSSTQPLDSNARTQDRLYPGNDRVVDLPKARLSPTPQGGEGVMLNFERAPLIDVIHTILGDVLKVPYSIDPNVKGEVVLHTSQPTALADLPSVLDTVLLANGAVLRIDDKGFYRVGLTDTMKNLPPSLRSTKNGTGQAITIIPLRFIGAQDMADILKPVAAPEAFMRVDTTRNLLVMIGTQNQSQAWMELVKTFDVDFMRSMSVGIFPLEYGDVKEVAKAIEMLISNDPKTTGGIIRVMPIERLNSLFVVTPRKAYLDQVRQWVTRLDQAPDNALEPSLYVYPVQNGDATHMAKVLGSLFGSGTGGTSTGTHGTTAPGLGESAVSGTSDSAGGTGSGSTTGNSGTGSGSTTSSSGTSTGSNTGSGSSTGGTTGNSNDPQKNSTTAVSLGKNIRVVADEDNNALLIYAPRREYHRIENAIRQLDIAPVQVLIEASIVEVTLTDKFQFGLQWYFTNGFGGSLSNFTGEGGFGNSIPLVPVVPGFNYTISDASGSIHAVLNALSSETSLKVVSSPSMLVLDNQKAEMQVGSQVPILTSATQAQPGIVPTQSYAYKDTGVLLTVIPRINAGNMVSLDVLQKVTDIGPIDPATKQRSFLQRSMKSKISVQSGQTAILGGLIRDNKDNTRNGIPGLVDIPVLGYLFGTTEKNKDRTELLVLLTPRVMENLTQTQQITEEIRSKLFQFTSLHQPLSSQFAP
jgi:general secretion pathway protein D